MSTESWFERLPKLELHLHLEGAIPHPALWELIRKYGGDPSVPSLEALEQRFRYRDFAHFIETWVWKNGFLREYDDFRFIAEAVARDLAQQKILYAEMFYSPGDFARHGLRAPGITEAVRSGLSQVSEIRVALVADLVRDFGPERGARVLAEIADVKELGVVGIGIGGSEAEFPPEAFADVYEDARRAGYRTSAHAGEAAGPESIRGALDALRVDRIGHGTRAYEDPALLDVLAERQIPLEMCPLSNVRTAVVPSLGAHPLRRYLEHGLLVTVNTDDPKMFGNSLAEELHLLCDELGCSREQVRALTLNAIRASWLSEEDKRALHAAFTGDPAWDEAGGRPAAAPGRDA